MRTIVAVLVGVALSASCFADDIGQHESVLKKHHIETDSQGLLGYLRRLHPDDASRRRAEQLVNQLGSDDFNQRESAYANLMSMPTPPIEALTSATRHPELEVRYRAASILRSGQRQTTSALYAVFKVIQEQKITGAAADILRSIPFCRESHVIGAAQQSLKVVATKQDVPLLRKSLTSDNTEIRIAAAMALGAVLAEAAAGDLNSLIDEAGQHDAVKLAAARTMADFGDRQALDALFGLLSSADVRVRTASANTLRDFTGEYFGFAAFNTAESRAEATAKWRQWIDDHGETSELFFPLKPRGGSYLNGNTLLAFGHKGKVSEFDPAGKEVWTFPCKGPWSAEKLANGNVLIAAYSGSRVLEVTPDKKIVWEHAINALNAKQLRNGNFLIACHNDKKCIEITRDKKVVWEYSPPGNCTDAHRLANGNTLVAARQGHVQEVTPDGKVVWHYETAKDHLYGIQPLDNGNILVADFARSVVELTREKKIVWEFTEKSATDAFRLPNGNTLITGGTRFIEVTPAGKIIWQQAGCTYGTARR